MRIAMIAACPFPHARGTPIRVRRAAEALVERGHEVHVVTYHLGEPSPPAPFTIHRIPSIPTYRRFAPGPTLQKLLVIDPLLMWLTGRVLRQHAIDIVHAHHFEGLLAAVGPSRRHDVPIVFDVHTLLASELPFYPLGLPRVFKRFVGKRLDTWLPRLADHLVPVTETIRDALEKDAGIPANKITVVVNGVRLASFACPNGSVARPAGGGKTLIFTGNLAPYQGIDLMLKAFRQVVDRRRDARLLIVSQGDFSIYDPLAKQLGIRDRIDVRNVPFAELAPCMAAGDVAINPRVACDGVPQKLLNYMAAGKPIVSFAGSAVTIEHGRTGWVVADDDVEGLAAGIVRLMDDEDLAGRLGANAKEEARLVYSWEKAAERLEGVYARLLRR